MLASELRLYRIRPIADVAGRWGVHLDENDGEIRWYVVVDVVENARPVAVDGWAWGMARISAPDHIRAAAVEAVERRVEAHVEAVEVVDG